MAGALDTQPEAGTGWDHKEPVRADRFMVTVANPVAARAGYDVLKRGGTAADAAVAVQLVLNLVEPLLRGCLSLGRPPLGDRERENERARNQKQGKVDSHLLGGRGRPS